MKTEWMLPCSGTIGAAAGIGRVPSPEANL